MSAKKNRPWKAKVANLLLQSKIRRDYVFAAELAALKNLAKSALRRHGRESREYRKAEARIARFVERRDP